MTQERRKERDRRMADAERVAVFAGVTNVKGIQVRPRERVM